MTTTTSRQEIFDRVVTQLKRISTDNTYTMYGQEAKSYLTDIGSSVFEWRAAPFQTSELPALIVRDLDEPQKPGQLRSERTLRQLHMQVEIVLIGDTPMDELRKIYADVEAAIGEGRETKWNDITSETRPRITRSILEQESNALAGGIFEFYIDYPTLNFQSVKEISD